MKPCEQCALCCKLIEVKGLSPAGEWCPHCTPGKKSGCCNIHSDRPNMCLGYDCFWRAEEWPDDLRPDRCKVIFESLPSVETILISVEPTRPDAWKKKRILAVIKKLGEKGRPLAVRTKNDSVIFTPKGWTKRAVLEEIKIVMDWKEKINDSTGVLN